MKNKMILATAVALIMVFVGGVAVAASPDDVGAAADPVGTAISDEAGLVAAANTGGNYYLTADLTLTADDASTANVTEGVIYISNGQTLTLDLNGHSISHNSRVFFITRGTFNVTGEGTIKETVDDQYSPICIKGSNTATDTNYTTVTIGKDVTLSGWAGIFITPYTSSGNPHAYGVTVNFNGKIIVPISGGTAGGHGIYINGQIQDKTNYPVINISDTAEITVTVGTGIYAAGYAQWNITGGTITGEGSGIAIKAGILNITGGSIICTGPDDSPTAGYSNGVNASGAAIQVESNNGYAKSIQITIGGADTVIRSDNGYAFYEYLASGTTATAISSINITGGSFSSERSTFCLSTELTGAAVGKNFITAATFDHLDALSYAASGAQVNVLLGVDTVIDSTLKISNKVSVILDLNGCTLSSTASDVIIVENGALTLTGTGSVISKCTRGNVIGVIGSATETTGSYSTLAVDKNVTLTGSDAVLIDFARISGTSTSSHNSCGAVVNFNGKITTTTSGITYNGGNSIAVNGSITNTSCCPTITIGTDASINNTTSDGNIIYAAGYADWTINGGTFSAENGVEIKAGTMTINGGSFTATGTVSNAENNNGTSSTGYALAVVENKNYATPTVVTVNGGSFNRITMIKDNDETGLGETLAINCDLTIDQDADFVVTGHGQLTVGADKTLTIASGTEFSVLSGGKIVNEGTIINNSTIANGGTIENNGTVTNNGALVNNTAATITNTGAITSNESFVNNGTISGNGAVVNNGVCFGVTPTENNGSVSEVEVITNVTDDIVLEGADVGKGVVFTVSSDFGVGPISVDFGNDCTVSFTPTAGSAYAVTVALDQNAVGPNGEAAYDIVVSGTYTGPVTITLPRSGSGVPSVNYVAPDGTTAAMTVSGYTDTTVTFYTDHNSRYLVGSAEEPTAPPVSSYRVTITPGLGYSIACSAGNVFTLSADSSMNFRICATDGYQLMGVFASNAKLVNLGGGYYTVSDVTANATITVQVQKVSNNDSNDNDDSSLIAAIIAAAAAAGIVAACAGYVYWRK